MPKIPLRFKTFKGSRTDYARALAKEQGITFEEALAEMQRRAVAARVRKIPAPKPLPSQKPETFKEYQDRVSGVRPETELPGLWKSGAYRAGLMDKMAVAMRLPMGLLPMSGMAARNISHAGGNRPEGIKKVLMDYIRRLQERQNMRRSGMTADEIERGMKGYMPALEQDRRRAETTAKGLMRRMPRIARMGRADTV